MIEELKKILLMIENVDPSRETSCDHEGAERKSSDILDDINKLYEASLGYEVRFWPSDGYASDTYHVITGKNFEGEIRRGVKDYTRSRDLLKLERPDGWNWVIKSNCNMNSRCDATKEVFPCHELHSMNLPTEELAEFYAIIQAKIWEAENER